MRCTAKVRAERSGWYIATGVDWVFGDERFEIYEQGRNKMLMLKRVGVGFGRTLFYLGSNEFHPAGAAQVRVRFTLKSAKVMAVTVQDAEFTVTGERIG